MKSLKQALAPGPRSRSEEGHRDHPLDEAVHPAPQRDAVVAQELGIGPEGPARLREPVLHGRGGATVGGLE
eukprot:1681247-Lingulodinium_polyedra.AAC.1